MKRSVTGRITAWLLVVLAAACGTSRSSEETAQIATVEQLAKDDKISLSEMLTRKRAIYRENSGLNQYQERYFQRTIDNAQRLETGNIVLEDFMLLEADARQDMEMMQKLNYMEVRLDNRDTDRSGLGSTNGFVAITSMVGLLADSVTENKACR